MTKSILSEKEVINFINDFVEKIHNGSAAIFAGAELSKCVGYVDWEESLTDIFNNLELDKDEEKDYATVAQYYVNKHGSDMEKILKEKIINKLSEDNVNYDKNRQLFTERLKTDLALKNFLFLGFSFEDPNLNYILGRLRVLLDKNLEKVWKMKSIIVYEKEKKINAKK